MRFSVAVVLILATGCGRKPLDLDLAQVDAALAVRPRASVVIVNNTQTTTPAPTAPATTTPPPPAPPPMSGDPRPDANFSVAPASRVPDAAPPPAPIPDATAAAAPVTPPPPDAAPPQEMSDIQARYLPLIRDVDAQTASLRATVNQAGTRASGTLHSQVAQVVDLRNRLVDGMNRGLDDRTLDQHAEDLRRALESANESARRELNL